MFTDLTSAWFGFAHHKPLSVGLGSITYIVQNSDRKKFEMSFDAWGNRRNPTNWTYTGVPSSFTFNRGYTGHEMLDAFGLINMNGRMYDPVLGRMLSPDNYVSSAGSTQAFNRYSYALNNPLVYTDPNGDMPFLAIVAFAAYQGFVAGHMGMDNQSFAGGFAQSFGTSMATSLVTAGVGNMVGSVVGGTTRAAEMMNAGIHAAIGGGLTYGFGAVMSNSEFNWKAYGMNIATSMALAGLTYQKPSYEYIDSNSLWDVETKDLTRSKSLALISTFNEGSSETTLQMRLEYQVLNEETTGCKISSKLVRKNIMRAKYGLSKSGKILNWDKKEVVGGFYCKSVITISPFNVNFASQAELEGILLHEYVHHLQFTHIYPTIFGLSPAQIDKLSNSTIEYPAYEASYLHALKSGDLNKANSYNAILTKMGNQGVEYYSNPALENNLVRRLTSYKRF